MNQPGLVRSRSGAYRLHVVVDQAVQGWPVFKWGRLCGVYLDDTTPNLTTIWLPAAKEKYITQLGLKVFVGIATGQPRLHHQGCVNLYEAYPYGMPSPVEDYFAMIPLAAEHCEGFIAQSRWTGLVGRQPPSAAQIVRLMHTLEAFNKPYLWLY